MGAGSAHISGCAEAFPPQRRANGRERGVIRRNRCDASSRDHYSIRICRGAMYRAAIYRFLLLQRSRLGMGFWYGCVQSGGGGVRRRALNGVATRTLLDADRQRAPARAANASEKAQEDAASRAAEGSDGEGDARVGFAPGWVKLGLGQLGDAHEPPGSLTHKSVSERQRLTQCPLGLLHASQQHRTPTHTPCLCRPRGSP